MGVKYSIRLAKNPQRPDEPGLYYPQAQVRERINIYRIAREIGWATSLTEGDVLNVLQTMIVKIKEHLGDGDNVSLGEFGTFQYQIRGKGAVTMEEFNYKTNIQGVKFQFRPGSYMKDSMDRLDFDYVVPVKVRQQMVRQEKEKLKNANVQPQPEPQPQP